MRHAAILSANALFIGIKLLELVGKKGLNSAQKLWLGNVCIFFVDTLGRCGRPGSRRHGWKGPGGSCSWSTFICLHSYTYHIRLRFMDSNIRRRFHIRGLNKNLWLLKPIISLYSNDLNDMSPLQKSYRAEAGRDLIMFKNYYLTQRLIQLLQWLEWCT